MSKLRDIVNSVYLDANGMPEFNSTVANATVDIAYRAIISWAKEQVDEEELKKIVSDIGNSTRYDDNIGGVDVQPILWAAIPDMASKAIKQHIDKNMEKR